MMTESDWRPSASLDCLRLRARLLAAVRRFFDERGYWEVDTPLASRERVIDPHLDPFALTGEPGIPADAPASRPVYYLQTSPEFAMKRLLAAGADAIYQVGHVFRRGERGARHNPEFTLVEWYRTGTTHLDQMQVVEELVRAVWSHAQECNVQAAADRMQAASAQSGPAPVLAAATFRRTTYRDAFRRHVGDDLAVKEAGELCDWAQARGLFPPPGLRGDDRDGWLNWLLAELIEPRLGADIPEFLIDYPASQGALARLRADDPPVAERFELYVRGIELCNGYHELPDPRELQGRIEAESARRVREGWPPLEEPHALLAAMEAGLPDCAGVALGFDRLMMVMTGARTIDEVLPFGWDRC